MRIEKGMVIAGLPAIKIRNLFRKLYNFIDPEIVAEILEVDLAEGKRIFDVLLQEGYVEKDESGERFEPSSLALRLKTASAAPPIPRQKATELIEGFLRRVTEVNTDPSFLFKVNQVVLFGSYLNPQTDLVGDVDLAVSIDRKPGVTQEDERRQTSVDIKEGLNVPSGFAEIWWQASKVYKHLKSGKRGVAMVDLAPHAEMLSKVPAMQIYPMEKK